MHEETEPGLVGLLRVLHPVKDRVHLLLVDVEELERAWRDLDTMLLLKGGLEAFDATLLELLGGKLGLGRLPEHLLDVDLDVVERLLLLQKKDERYFVDPTCGALRRLQFNASHLWI